MWPDRVSNPGPPTYESGALPIALRGPAILTFILSANLNILQYYICFLRYVSIKHEHIGCYFH